jgi:transcriptional regulator with XRE-family HTH domain
VGKLTKVPSEQKKILGENIKRAREKRGLEQGAFAKQLHLTQAAVSRYETGERELTATRLADVATVLKISPSRLLKGVSKWNGGARKAG